MTQKGTASPTTLVVLYPGCVAFEVLLAADILSCCQFTSTSDLPHVDGSGLRIDPTLPFAEAAARRFDVVLVPGGIPDAIIDHGPLHSLLKDATASGSIVGGICAGVLVLAAAGVLAGRRITHNYCAPYCPADVEAATKSFWHGAIVEDSPCVVDGTLVTAKPYAFIDFATTIARKAAVYDHQEEAHMNRYFKGTYAGPRT